MSLPGILGSMSMMLEEVQVNELLLASKVSEGHGLTLTADAAKEILTARNQVLQSLGRVELDIEVLKKLVQSFSTSTYIEQEEYAAVLMDLVEVFHYMKNETEDQIGDDALIETMKAYFENECGGAIELLKGRELEAFARNIRQQSLEMGDFVEEEVQLWRLSL